MELQNICQTTATFLFLLIMVSLTKKTYSATLENESYYSMRDSASNESNFLELHSMKDSPEMELIISTVGTTEEDPSTTDITEDTTPTEDDTTTTDFPSTESEVSTPSLGSSSSTTERTEFSTTSIPVLPEPEQFFKKPVGYITASVGAAIVLLGLGGTVGYLHWKRKSLIDSGRLKLIRNEI